MGRDDQILEVMLDHRGPVRVRFGVDEEGRRRNRLEVLGRAWARQHGICVPDIVDHDPTGAWLVSEDVETGPRHGRDFVDVGLHVADQIAGAPPMRSSDEGSGWRAPRRGRALRAARLWRAGISPTEFMRLRRAVHDLPAQVAIHGDLYDGNVLIIDDRSAALIDWEHAGVGPRYSDAIRFLTTLSRDEDAEYALECILRQAPTSDRELIGAQLRWLSLRHYADQITAEESAVSLQHREHIRQRWQQAMTWAAEIAPEPDQSAGTD